MKRPNTWGVAVVVVYAVFAASTIGFVVFAMTQPVDLVSPDYYQRSLLEDRKIQARANADALGRAVSIDVDRELAVLRIRIPSDEAVGTVTLYRPSGSSADRTLALAIRAGEQRIPLIGLASGRWLVQLDWSAGGRSFYYEAGAVLP